MYIVEGTIGAGKSTFLRLLDRYLPQASIALEPVQSWHSQSEGQSLLSHFYKDPYRWAYTMETFAMAKRVTEHLKDQDHPSPYRFVERSIYSGHYCFALNSYAQGFLSSLEWAIYQEWFSTFVSRYCRPPQGFIYLRVSPEVAYQRVQQRQREGENTITLEYLQNIHACHENFLLKKQTVLDSLKEVPVLTLEVNQDFEHDQNQQHAHCSAVAQFVGLSLFSPQEKI
jgi:deoxyadenosine/deoxycytidine kinase